MLLSSISETTYYEKREKNGTSVGGVFIRLRSLAVRLLIEVLPCKIKAYASPYIVRGL